jgi:hypothetical protein
MREAMRMAAAALPLSTARPTLDFGCAISEIRLPSAIIGVYAEVWSPSKRIQTPDIAI